MRKKMILRLSMMIVSLTLFWSCRNEDFIQSEKKPQRNNQNFFKHTKNGGVNARSGVDYVDILEGYNRDKDFLSHIPDQTGMPIWEKMRVLDSEHSTGLIIPLSDDNETLSSVLFATLDEKNTITGVKDYDNSLLEKIIYDPKIDKDYRQGILTSYLVTDHYTFDTTEFTNIPTDLFNGIKHGKDSIKLSFNGYVKGESGKSVGAKLMISTTCLNIYHCKNNKPPSQCDGCSSCVTRTCGTEYVFTDEDLPTTTPGNPGSGGGGGSGGTTVTPQPPKDPCTLSVQAFYRLKPGCDGGSGYPDLPDLDDPCERYQIPVNNSNDILHMPNISTEMATMKNHAANSNVEYGTAIMNIGSSTVAQDPYTDNNPGQISIYLPTVGDYVANAHTHPCHGVSAPSLGDFYGDLKNIKNYLTFQVGYIFSCNGSIYAFVVEDRQKAIDFLNAFPEAENLSPNRQLINNNSQLGKDFNEILENYMTGSLPSYSGNSQRDGLESGLAQILEKYNSGMVLAKTDLNGDLKPLSSVKFQYTIPASGGKKITGYKAQPCP